jgi:DNA-directed RNA polymerase specialized sigma24 family protein
MHHPARSASHSPRSAVTAGGGHDVHAALARAAAAGDQAAWTALVERFAGLVWATARTHGLSSAQAASAAQATWLRLAQDLNQIHELAHVGVWLAATARQESLRVLRLGGQRDPIENEIEGTLGNPPPGRDTGMWQAFASLPAGCRRLLRVAATDPPPSSAEISAALAIPIADVAPTRRRCLDLLRQQPEQPTFTAYGGHHA